ncbi:MAG: hypothetical protein BKP49_07380 [Treponema sp. CETP13]|nr:MAG: hypothetical protein BKP49_07380 [Treponema sp. CETP13]
MITVINESLVEHIFQKFIRTYPEVFSMETLKDFFAQNDCSLEKKILFDYVSTNPMVFKLDNGLFISRAGLFTNKKFSIKPFAYEIEAGILIPGHRTMPFTDPNQIPDRLEFFVNGKVVQKKIVTLPKSKIIPAYTLYGEEYVSQIISYDTANDEKNFAEKGFEIPDSVSITVLDLQNLYKEWRFTNSDRLILEVVDWNLGFITIKVQKNLSKNALKITKLDYERDIWNRRFEKCLLESMHSYGMCSSIEEQLAYAFFVFAQNYTIDFCGSVEDFLATTSSFVIAPYGIESRIILSSLGCPLFLDWCDFFEPITKNTLYPEIGIPLSYYVLQACILDSLYNKEDTLLGVLTRIYPDNWAIGEKEKNYFLAYILKKYGNESNIYNYFTDYKVGNIRNKALTVFFKLISLLSDLKVSKVPLKLFNNQSLIIFRQLILHVNQLIEILVQQKNLDSEDLVPISLSLEGIDSRYDEINVEIRETIKMYHYDCFKLL